MPGSRVGQHGRPPVESTGKQEDDMATWCSEAPHSLVGPSSLDQQTLRGVEEECLRSLRSLRGSLGRRGHSEALVLASLAAFGGRIMAAPYFHPVHPALQAPELEDLTAAIPP
ncbi:uncharacterized protein VDAG_03169 [Verticillium dahliae VdLs.17]|uniref:Uncharacterized protein n=1 Tax=Verticillium dahliae (strain VdLs.17 / ATCC MYA-4575 / FGSC 10137) TaxID=498257 RepID=G2WYS7_VERDV|nr:uncharacterized protein VDAG_03169 [Verticillium dahliae VdLs.17]EGY21729.1 hypothetical protein VDAG_03169 [Verticillium dahliae VdLs.17]